METITKEREELAMRHLRNFSMLSSTAVLLIATSVTSASAASISPADYVSKDPKVVWGGGPVAVSSYSGKIVPAVIESMEKVRLAGYGWGGPSKGTYENALRVTMNPTHLALGQGDILKTLNGTTIPGTDLKYTFTTVQADVGDECLYMASKSPHYKTFGHVLENAWDLVIATGGELSGSYGSLQHVLMAKYPKLRDAQVKHVGGAKDILNAVVNGDTNVMGFFVMRPDPKNQVFKIIDDKGLTLVPVVDFDLEGTYAFKELKIASGGLLGSAKYHTTACTQVQVITGDPTRLQADQSRHKRRLEATIKRMSAIDGDALKKDIASKFTSWSDYLDSVKIATGSKLNELMEASKKAAKKGLDVVTQ